MQMKKRLFLTAVLCAALQSNAQTTIFSQSTTPSTVGVVSDVLSNGNFVASADDFTLTNQSTITKIKIEGIQSAGTLDTTVATGLSLYIYADNGGSPAGIPNNPAVAPIAKIDIAKGAPGYNLIKTGTKYTFSVDLTTAMPNPLTLQPGTVYWLVFLAKTNLTSLMPASPNARFEWFPGQATGNPAKIIDPSNIFGIGISSWTGIAALTGVTSFNGLAFSLEGTSVLGVKEVFNSRREVMIFPNPAKDVISIKSELKINNAEIIDASGRKLKANINNGDKVDVKNLQPGNYIIRMETKDGIKTEKFIKE